MLLNIGKAFLFKKKRGVTVQNMIIGGVLGAILAAVAISVLWSSLERQKISGIASSIVAQYELLDLMEADRFVELNELEDTIGDGDIDYLDELRKARLIKFDPSDYFDDENATWEIRRMVRGDSFPVYYIYIYSSLEKDMERVREACKINGVSNAFEHP